MATEKKTKKNIGEQITDIYSEYSDAYKANAQQQADALKLANDEFLASQEAAELQRQQQAAATNNKIQDLLNQGYSAQEAMYKASQDRIAKAEAEDVTKYKADLNAAKYSGLTELAASVANMIGVGGHNAANQQYRQYSLDWMRKADQDMHLRRARIDNLRERQRALQQHLSQLKQQNGLTILQQQAAEDAARAKYAQDRNAMVRDAAIAQAKIIGDANDKAADARLKGQAAGIEAAEQQRQFNARMGEQAASRKMHENQFAAQMRAKGLNANGSLNPDYVKENAGWTKDKDGKWKAPKSTGADDMINFRVNKYGEDAAFDWRGSASRLSESLLTSIDTFTDLSNDAKEQITEILTGSGKGADKVDAIKRYIGTSPQMREFIKTLNEKTSDEEEEPSFDLYKQMIGWGKQE